MTAPRTRAARSAACRNEDPSTIHAIANSFAVVFTPVQLPTDCRMRRGWPGAQGDLPISNATGKDFMLTERNNCCTRWIPFVPDSARGAVHDRRTEVDHTAGGADAAGGAAAESPAPQAAVVDCGQRGEHVLSVL